MENREAHIAYLCSAIKLAAVSFGFVDAVRIVIYSMIQNQSAEIRLSAVMALVLFEVIQMFVFLLVAFPMGCILLGVVINIIRFLSISAILPYVAIGVLIALVFLPVCAGIPFLVLLGDLDAPSYLHRCLDFLGPMLAAGSVGGYVFGRLDLHHAKMS